MSAVFLQIRLFWDYQSRGEERHFIRAQARVYKDVPNHTVFMVQDVLHSAFPVSL